MAPRALRGNCRGARGTSWSDVLLAIGVVFLLLAVAVNVLLLASPFIATPSVWTPYEDVLGGGIGLLLIGLGIYHRRTERRA